MSSYIIVRCVAFQNKAKPVLNADFSTLSRNNKNFLFILVEILYGKDLALSNFDYQRLHIKTYFRNWNFNLHQRAYNMRIIFVMFQLSCYRSAMKMVIHLKNSNKPSYQSFGLTDQKNLKSVLELFGNSAK